MIERNIPGALQSLKRDRALLTKRKIRKRADVLDLGANTYLNLKESTSEDMERIRKKIQSQKRKERFITRISIILTIIISYFLFDWIVL